MKFLSFLLSSIILTASFVSAEYVKGDQTTDFTQTPFTDTLSFQYFDAIVNGVGLKEVTRNGETCFANFYALMDKRYDLDTNITTTRELNDADEDQSTFYYNYYFGANTSLMVGSIMANELADTIDNCTTVFTETWITTIYNQDMYFNSGSTFMQIGESFVLNIIGGAVVYKEAQLALSEGWQDKNYPLILQELIKVSWYTIFFSNVYYAAAEEAGDVESAMPLQLRIENSIKETMKTYKHPRVQQDEEVDEDKDEEVEVLIIEPSEYEIPEAYDEYAYTIFLGTFDVYTNFFNYYSNMQQCDRMLRRTEQRVARFNDNYYPNQYNYEGTVYDFIDQQAIYFSDVLRMGTDVAYSCQVAAKDDFYLGVYNDLIWIPNQTIIRMWLKHSLIIFDDVLAIMALVGDGISWNEHTLLYIAIQLLYSLDAIETHVPDTGIDYFPYPYDELDDDEEDYLTDQTRDIGLVSGIKYRQIGEYIGDILARLTMEIEEEEEDEDEDEDEDE